MNRRPEAEKLVLLGAWWAVLVIAIAAA